MELSKLNESFQILAAAGVIIGLVLVAYELRMSNTIAWEEASADSLERWDRVSELLMNPGTAELLLRTHGEEELSREETVKLNAFLDVALSTLLHDYRLLETRSLGLTQGFEAAYSGAIQYYLGSQYGHRRWEVQRHGWPPDFADAIDSALKSPSQRNVFGDLDYTRGAIDRVD